jgi:hypothetical protein
MDYATLVYLWQTHAYVGFAILVIGWLVQLTTKESSFPVFIAPRYRPLIVAVLGLVSAGLHALQGGLPWRQVVLQGLLTGFLTMGLYDLFINAFWNGNTPKWLAWLAFMRPQIPTPPTSEKAISVKPPADAETVKVLVPSMRPPPIPDADITKESLK